MTTTGPFWTPPAPTRQRVLRRSRTDRVGAGVAGGLGEYFGLDPVLFRVLFATAAFFAGAGILAYLLAWAAIPEAGTEHAPIDNWVSALRRRRIPFLVVVVAGAFVLWAVAFSWWTPRPLFPALAILLVLIAVSTRRSWRADAEQASAAPVNLTKQPGAATPFEATPTDPAGPAGAPSGRPAWVDETRRWMRESREATRRRRRRALPIKIATLVTLIVALVVLGTVDAVHGIALPVYFWVSFGILLLGLLVGVVLRRTPWSMAWLLFPVVVGLIGFSGTHASLHDGSGRQEWTPTTTAASSYKLAFGQGVLDLRQLPALTNPRTINVTAAAGQIRVLLPATLNATVDAHVHFGQIEVDGLAVVTHTVHGHERIGGYNVDHVVRPASTATGPALTIDVHLADGDVSVQHY